MLGYFMAQAHEALGELDLAIEALDCCIELLPESIEYWAAAAQWLAKSGRYEEANHYAEKGLLCPVPVQLPRLLALLSKVLALILRQKAAGDLNQQIESSYLRQMKWLKEYTLWYQRKN